MIDFGKLVMPIYSTCISILLGYLFSIYKNTIQENKQLKEQKKREDEKTTQTIIETLRYLMLDSLKGTYNELMEKKDITTEDKQQWDSAFGLYHDGLKGDGAGDMYNDAISQKTIRDHIVN